MAKLARSYRKHTHSRSNGKPTSRPRNHRRTLVPKTLQRSIAKEANQLGLTVEEYVRMAIAISKSFRDTVKTDSSFDMKSVAKLVDSPIWPILMQTVGPVVTGMLESSSKDKKDTDHEQSSAGVQPPSTGVPRPYPPFPQIPGQQIPGQQIPGQQIPGQQIPGQQIPGQQIPGQQIPRQNVPNQQIPVQQTPTWQPPGQPWPGSAPPVPYEYW